MGPSQRGSQPGGWVGLPQEGGLGGVGMNYKPNMTLNFAHISKELEVTLENSNFALK